MIICASPAADARERFVFCRAGASADDQFDAIAGGLEDAARGKIVLRGENFGGSHQRDLIAIFDDDRGGFERDDRLAAADVAFEQAIHRVRAFEIGGDFGEHAFLRGGRLERQNAF